MYDLPDHPAIRNAELTGYPRSVSLRSLRCPGCGEELTIDDDVYLDYAGDIVGCSRCIVRREASEVCDDD